jgi:hypothetical protein
VEQGGCLWGQVGELAQRVEDLSPEDLAEFRAWFMPLAPKHSNLSNKRGGEALALVYCDLSEVLCHRAG